MILQFQLKHQLNNLSELGALPQPAGVHYVTAMLLLLQLMLDKKRVHKSYYC